MTKRSRQAKACRGHLSLTRKTRVMARRTKKEESANVLQEQASVVQAESIGINPGDWISINLRKQAHFGIADAFGEDRFSIWLNRKNWCAQIPNDVTPGQMAQISRGILAGNILVGKHKVTRTDKDPAVKTQYLAALDVIRSQKPDKNFRELIRTLVIGNMQGGYSALEILDMMLEYENAHKKRADIIEYLAEAREASESTNTIRYEAEDLGDEEQIVFDGQTVQRIHEDGRREVIRSTGTDVVEQRPSIQEIVNATLG